MTDASMNLTEFLLARIAEDEAAATDGWSYGSPARVLAECTAKRRIVENAPDRGRGEYYRGRDRQYEGTLMELAAVYAEHPDFREDWLP